MSDVAGEAAEAAKSIIASVKSTGRIRVGGKTLNRVSRPGEAYNEHELMVHLRQGPDAIEAKIAKLRKYIADPAKAAKREMYEAKLDQLEKLLAIKLPLPPTAT